MADDSADRVRGPGHQPVPERDVEPVWPPEHGGPTAAQGHLPADDAPVVDHHAYPSLSQPPPPAVPRTTDDAATPWAVNAPVDLHSPFTMDQPVPVQPVQPVPVQPAPPPVPQQPVAVPEETGGRAAPEPPRTPWTAPRHAATSDEHSAADDPSTGNGRPSVTGDPSAGGGRTPGAGTPSAGGGRTPGAGTQAAGGGRPSGGHGPSNGGGRASQESPWAQPPQRVAGPGSPDPVRGGGPPHPATTQIPQPPSPAAPIPQPTTPADPVPEPTSADPIPHSPTPADPIPQSPIPAGPDPAAPEAEGARPGPRPPTFAPPVPVPPRVDQSGPVPPAAPHPASGHADPATPPQAAPGPGAHTLGPGAHQETPGQDPAGWPPATWHQGSGHPMPPQSYPGANAGPSAYPGADAGPQSYPGVDAGPSAYPATAWSPEPPVPPTAEDFARRRQLRPPDPVATVGLRAVINKTGLVKLPPGRHEQELRQDIEMVRRNFGGLRQVTVVNPKGGAGKTVAILLLAMTFGQKRGGYVLAWDNNETQGTLGMRAQQDFHSRTVRDLLRDLGQFEGAQGRVGDLSQYVRSQGEGMFDVLASDESATGGEMLTAAAFGELREVVSRFYKLIFVDTGNNVRAHNWQAAMDATDQLVVTMSARNDSAETAARMLDHLEQSGRQRLVRQAVTVVSMPPSRKEIDLPAIQQHFAARTRAVLLAPYERLIDSGEPIRYGGLSAATRDAWLKIAASVAEGL